MSDSPYILASLTATKAGIPDPSLEVDCWLDRLRDILTVGPATALERYDLLALWARLWRCRPELIHQLQGQEELDKAEKQVSRGGADLARHAMTVPNPAGWLEETKELEAAFEEARSHEVRGTLAERLLTDLDDADLALYAAARLGVADLQLEEQLARCNEWLAQNAELFLPASVHIQAVAMALRPDLEQFDYGLAATALKYVDLLRAAEIAEQDLALATVSPLAPEVVKELVRRYRLERDRQAMVRALFVVRAARILAAMKQPRPMARAGQETAPEPPQFWQWGSPTGGFTARLVIAGRPDADEQALLEFVGPEMLRATSLAGQPVALHGVEGVIDSQGKATFALARLLDTEEPLVLRVGEHQTEWLLKVENADS